MAIIFDDKELLQYKKQNKSMFNFPVASLASILSNVIVLAFNKILASYKHTSGFLCLKSRSYILTSISMGSATQWMKALGFSASSTGVAFTKKHNFVKIQKFIFIFSSEATQKITKGGREMLWLCTRYTSNSILGASLLVLEIIG